LSIFCSDDKASEIIAGRSDSLKSSAAEPAIHAMRIGDTKGWVVHQVGNRFSRENRKPAHLSFSSSS